MRGVESIGDLAAQISDGIDRKRARGNELLKGLSFQILHGQERDAVLLSDLVKGDDMVVLEGGVALALAQEPLRRLGTGENVRADGCASIRVDAPLGVVLPALAAGYLGRRLGP